MEQTEHKFDIDLFKRIISKKICNFNSIIVIAMIIICIIIAIFLMNDNRFKNNEIKQDKIRIVENDKKLVLCNDDKILSFVENYFKARTDLHYDVIFKSFNKNFKNEIYNEEEKRIISSIRYERSYVKSYDNILVYTYDGINDNEFVVVILYDMQFSYTTGSVPNIILSYIVRDDGKYYFRDNIDVGLSKYLNEVASLDEVKALYLYVETKLEKAISEDEDLKLTYNSLRQYKMNGYQQLDDYSLSTEIISMNLDPVKDKDVIDKILEKNKLKQVNTKHSILKKYISTNSDVVE